MENRKPNEDDIQKINAVLVAAGYPEASNFSLEHAREEDAILRYIPNCSDRDAALGASALRKEGLQINYDGDPSTTEEGIDQDTVPPSYVIMVRLPMWGGE